MSPLRQRLVWIVLALSLALNVSLIVGVIYADQQMKPPLRGEAMIAALSKSLPLSDAQRQELTAIRVSVMDRFAARERQGQDWGNILAGVLRQPAFDGGALKLGLIERDAGRIDFFISTMSRLYDFTKALTPEARQSFLTEIESDESFLRRLFGPDRDTDAS